MPKPTTRRRRPMFLSVETLDTLVMPTAFDPSNPLAPTVVVYPTTPSTPPSSQPSSPLDPSVVAYQTSGTTSTN